VRKVALLAASVGALAAAVPAAAGVRVASVDTSGYPEVRVTVVAPVGSGTPRLTEDGVPATDVQAANLGHAKSIALAVDRSESMRGKSLADATAAAREFVAAKKAGDRIEVIAFGQSALALTRFSSSAFDADAALRSLSADTRIGTALWDAVVLAAHRLRAEQQPGHAILVVTDGQDVSSTATFEQAVAAARAARAAVYTIGVAGHGFTPAPLRQLAAQTGGVYLQASSSKQLAALYASIGRTLARTWQLRYVTAARPGDRISVGVSLPSGGSGTETVTLPAVGVASVPADSPSGLLPRGAWVSPLAPVVLAGVVGLLVLLAVGFVVAARKGGWLRARLAPHLGPSRRRGKARRRRDRSFLRGVLAATEHAFANVRQFRALQRMLIRADLPLLGAELLYICLGAGVVVGLVCAAAGLPSLIVLLVTLAGGAAPVAWVANRARTRMRAFDTQLPDLLITIAASLKAGHSFRHAIQAVVDEGAEPAAKEFRKVLTETRLGRPMDDALTEMSERIGSKNLTFVLNSVAIQRQIGGSLAGLFDMVADTVRQRQQFARKIRSLTAMGRMSAYVLGALPFGVAILISMISPTYMEPLWHTTAGHELVGMGLVMLAVGGVILKRIVSFKG
jgi:tight adherence protein B